MKRSGKKGIRLLIPGLVISALLAALFFVRFTSSAKASGKLLYRDEPTTVTIQDSEDLIQYAYELQHGRHNTGDTLSFAISGGDLIDLTVSATFTFNGETVTTGYIGLGSEGAPFIGTLEIPGSSTSTFRSDVPLFNSIATGVSINDGASSPSTRELVFIRNSQAGEQEPLFAALVEDGGSTTPPLWKIRLEYDDANGASFGYGGVIGEIADDCKVSVEFTDNGYYTEDGETERSDVKSSDNVGIICGTLGEAAELTVKISGSNFTTAGQTVTSTGGHAGGIVGQMKDGSTLIFDYYPTKYFSADEIGEDPGLPEDGGSEPDATPSPDETDAPVQTEAPAPENTPAPAETPAPTEIPAPSLAPKPDVPMANDGNDHKDPEEIFPEDGAVPGAVDGSDKEEPELIAVRDADREIRATIISNTGFAGGIVGHAVNAEIVIPSGKTVTVSGTLNGNASAGGAGGMFGYYNSTTDNGTGADAGKRVFDFSQFRTTSSFTISGGKDSGGIFGKLEAQNSVVITAGENFPSSPNNSSTFKRKVNLNAGNNRGGVIGSYTNTTLANSLEIKEILVYAGTNANPTESGTPITTGGLIGKNYTTSVGNYISIHDVAVKNSGGSTSPSFSAALVGDMGNNGSFVDVSGRIAATGKFYAGLVWRERAGVIRIAGYTDFGTGGYFSASAVIDTGSNCGQLVGKRDNGLVYALGTGSDSLTNNVSDGWTFRRSGSNVDDIGDWGEALHGITESDFFTVDMTAHTVTVKAPVTSMGTTTDFIKTALNIQLNVSENPSDGALKFADSSNTSTVLLRTNLEITDDISLADTGIVELTRDNGANAVYTGTFDGNGKTITLAIGEAYGLSKDGAALSNGASGSGIIYKHKYQGLFAKASGAEFTDITVSGFDYTTAASETYIGGLAASSTGNLTLTDVTTAQDDFVYAASEVHCGGAVGHIEETATGTVDISNCVFSTDMLDARSGESSNKHFGGAIGYVRTTSSMTFDVDTVTLNGTYSKTNNKNGAINYGGLISTFYPTNTAADSNNRKVNITNLTVGDGVSVSAVDKTTGSDRTSGAGAFIGSEWPNVDVKIGTSGNTNGITVGTNDAATSPTIAVAASSANGNVGALFYKASGHMEVYHVEVVEASITSACSDSTFGFIVNDAFYAKTIGNNSFESALYLDVFTENYDIAATTLTASVFESAYDEIAAFSKKSGTDLASNGQAIISINLPSGAPINMTSGTCNTYQNQNTADYQDIVNENTRYYYNLAGIRAKASASATAGEKLLMWSVNRYAHGTAEGCFTNGFTNVISGECDMIGLSYYPVDASGMTISPYTDSNDESVNTVIKFYNDEIETMEGSEGADGDSHVRSTRANVESTQHRLMHEAIFRNYTGNLTVNGLTVQGNVSNQNGGVSGFLIRGTFGNDDEVVSRANINDVVLDGAYISGRTSGDYAPLLVNSIGSNSKFDITGVSTTGYPNTPTTDPTVPVASSLIGNVGSTTAKNINLTFSEMALDSRTAALSNGTADAALTAAYGTTRSIFDRATFLESFKYLSGSRAIYNYTCGEDWGDPVSTSDPPHRVTYASEVSESVEFADKENHYYDDAEHYTDPTTPNHTASPEYDFSSGFLPHVHLPYTTSGVSTDKQHEIRVNMKDVNMTNGCGQYNDPYVITDGGMLVTAARIINGDPDDGIVITLPEDLGADMWCDYKLDATNATKDYEYTFNDTTKKFVCSTTGVASKDLEDVRVYLAGAYYSIESTTITLPSAYIGMGSSGNSWDESTSFECQYAFRGVIVGHNNTVINLSPNPLVLNSNGCVVKEVVVQVGDAVNRVSVTIYESSTGQFTYSSTSFQTYGAVIGKVMGGDTIIDKVSVNFTNILITQDSSGEYNRLVPVGGYIGVVVNGGVIFRNMDGEGQNITGLTSSNCSFISDPGWLYVNPIIGRVITGYAFTEADSYDYSAASVTMRNSANTTEVFGGQTITVQNNVKNYVIPDLDPDAENLLTVEATGKDAHTITVPDGQALHILSYIVNSGAGSASYHASSDKPYATINNSPWIAYRNYCQTRCAQYSDVGTPDAMEYCDDYNKIVKDQDVYSGSTKVPYIIRNYTSSTGTLFRARSICGNGNNEAVSEIEFSNTTYNLSAGYRGIGGIYNGQNVNAFRLRFKKITGSGAVINLNMVYQEYNHQSGTESTTNGTVVENYKPFSGAGFGLFNNLYQHSTDTADDTISGLTLTGSVFYDIRKMSFITGNYPNYDSDYWNSSRIMYAYGWNNYTLNSVPQTSYYPNSADRIEANTILHTGGLAGSINNAAYISGVSLNNLSVEGAKYTGGFIGYASGQNVTIDSPSSSGLTVKGGFCVGGIIGGFYGSTNASLIISGTENNQSELAITNIEVKGYPSCAKHANDKDDFSDNFHSAGGICGFLTTGVSGTTYKAKVEYVTVTGGSITAPHKDQRPNDLRYKICTGGFFGKVNYSLVEVSNCSVENTVIEGNLSGGFIGYNRYGLNGTFENITVDTVTVNSYNSAGGFIGYIYRQSSLVAISAKGLTIDGCSINSIPTNAERACSGGVFGGVQVGSWANGSKLDIADAVLRDITITRGNTDNTEALTHCGVGGIYGVISESATIATGHNIMLDNVTVNNTGNRTPGILCGTNNRNGKYKLVGVTVQNSSNLNMTGVSDATNGMYGTVGYVVFADWFGYSVPNTGLTQNTTDSSLNGQTSMLGNSRTDYPATSPYVPVNPTLTIGGASASGGSSAVAATFMLTGDGMAADYDSSAIKAIITNNGANPYKYSASYVSRMNSNRGKLSTYNTEQNTDIPNDFVVLVIDDVNKVNTTALVNAYLNLLANTDFNYAASNAAYNVVLKRIKYENGVFSVDTRNECNLKKGNDQFYMNITEVDSAGDMFSLIDVQFLDPANSSKVAYHLYVPVFVKKMLVFDFRVATGNGTNYESAWYDDNDRWGMAVMENLGVPATTYFEWSYIRSKNEWQTALNNGENQIRNYAKRIKLTLDGSNTNNLPDSTVLVLVDRQTGTPYYARFNSQVYNASTGFLNLDSFRAELDNPSSAAFEPVSFNDLLQTVGTFTATQSATGLFVEDTSAEHTNATVKIGNTYYRPFTSEDEEADPPVQRWSITFDYTETTPGETVPVTESYYISFFTNEMLNQQLDMTVYHYKISADRSFNEAAYPSRIQDPAALTNGDGIAHMILGNIFVQSGISVQATNANEEITEGNNILDITMSSTISLRSDIYVEIKGFLSADQQGNYGIEIFQSFLTYLTKIPANQKIIAGSPTCSGSFTISRQNVDQLGTVSYSDAGIIKTANYIEFRNGRPLNQYLLWGNSESYASNTTPQVTIEADVSLRYTGGAAIEAQFPERADLTQRTPGVTVSGSSNVGYDVTKAAVSKASITANDSLNRVYYRRKIRQAVLHFSANRSINGDEDKLGINPLEPETMTAVTYMTIDATGVYDLSELFEDAVGYNYLTVEIRLYTKNDGYETPLVLNPSASGTYFSRLETYGITVVANSANYLENNTVYTFDLQRSADDREISIPIKFSALTGAPFEQAGHTYSNFKVVMKVKLYKLDEQNQKRVFGPSEATDFFVYTNAKLKPDYID